MTNKITRRDVAKQFSIAIQLLLDWIDHRVASTKKINNNEIRPFLNLEFSQQLKSQKYLRSADQTRDTESQETVQPKANAGNTQSGRKRIS